MDKSTFYNVDWEDLKEFPQFAPWVGPGKDSKHFKCNVCKTGSLMLSNMGVEALKSHMAGSKKNKDQRKSKHEKNMDASLKNARSQTKIGFTHLNTLAEPASTPSSSHVVPDKVDLTENQSVNTGQVQSTIETKSRDIKRAELLLAMKSIVSHIPQLSLDDFSAVATIMFPDSQIAKRMEIGHTKIAYNINYGLAPYYKDKIYQSLLPKGDSTVPPKFVSCFDESYNSVTHNKQFDVHIVYFDEVTRRVTRKYLTSQFIGHGDADSLLNHFEVVHAKLDIKNLVQLSMDGPNVNWKMLDIAIEERQKVPFCPDLLIIGSYGLHVLHGAYQTGQASTEWNLGTKCLKPSYSIFNKAPARRADYMKANGQLEAHEGKNSAYLFPLKYCSHRWLENGKAMKRIMNIEPKIKSYFKFLNDAEKFPTKDDRFTSVRQHISSPVFRAIMAFSLWCGQ